MSSKNIFHYLPNHSPKIGVIGSASGYIMRNPKAVENAHRIGKEIAKTKSVLVNGACPGLPDEAAKAAKEAGGRTLGVSPAISIRSHIDRYQSPIEHYDSFFFTGTGLLERNILNIRSCNGVITLPGGVGTLHEWATAFDEGKPIGVLTGCGGIADHIHEILEFCKRPAGAQIIFDSDPEQLVHKLYKLIHEWDVPSYIDEHLIGKEGEVSKIENDIKAKQNQKNTENKNH